MAEILRPRSHNSGQLVRDMLKQTAKAYINRAFTLSSRVLTLFKLFPKLLRLLKSPRKILFSRGTLHVSLSLSLESKILRQGDSVDCLFPWKKSCQLDETSALDKQRNRFILESQTGRNYRELRPATPWAVFADSCPLLNFASRFAAIAALSFCRRRRLLRETVRPPRCHSARFYRVASAKFIFIPRRKSSGPGSTPETPIRSAAAKIFPDINSTAVQPRLSEGAPQRFHPATIRLAIKKETEQ